MRGHTQPVEGRIARALYSAVELEMLKPDQAAIIASRCRHFQAGADNLNEPEKKLSAYLQWISYLIAVHGVLRRPAVKVGSFFWFNSIYVGVWDCSQRELRRF